MTIPTTIAASGPYFPNGATTAFPFGFKASSDQDVTVVLISSAGVEEIVSSAGYAVTLAGGDDPGGTVTMAVAPVNDGRELWIYLDPTFLQEIKFEDEGAFNQTILNQLADEAGSRAVWLRERVGRALLVPRNGSALEAAKGKFATILADGSIAWASGTNPSDALRLDLIATGAGQGGELVKIIQPGAGAVAQTVKDAIVKGARTVAQFGAIGNGVADDRAAIAAADAQGPITFGEGAYRISTSLTIANHVTFLPGAYVVIPSGVIVTFAGSINAGMHKIFQCEAADAYVALQTTSPTREGFPEWWGAKTGDGAAGVRTANTAALTACMRAVPTTVLATGVYYTNGEVRLDQSYRSVRGSGRDKTAISSNHATAHVMNVGGVVGSYYVERPHISGMTLHRSVGATVGATVADDLLQGHGLHIRMISNAVVREVDTSGNLIGTYWANALSPLWEDCFDYMSGFGARCYSFYLDGEASDAMGTGFPSLIVFRGEKIRQTNAGAAALSYGMKVKGQYTDMWVNGVETAGVHKGLHLDGNGTNAHFNSHCHDSYKGDGALIDYVGEGNNITFLDFYAAPGVGATGQPITVNNGRNIQFIGTQISSYPGGGDGKIGALFNNCVGCRIEGNIVNHSTGVKFDTCYGSAADVDVVKFTGTGVAAIESAGGYGNRLAAGVVGVTGAVNYAVGVKLSVSGGNTVDLTRVLDSAVTDRLTIDAAAVADGGTVIGDNHVIRPGAQPILASGTYTPTLTNGVNVAGSAAYAGQWSRVGDIVTVAGHIDVAPTSAGASTIMGISLPVASNLGAIADCNGSFGSDGEVGCSGAIYGDVANDRATLGYIAPSVTPRGLFYSFSYRVI